MLGNPENRRVTAFVAAARALDLEPTVVAHRDLLSEPERLRDLPREAVVRMESVGEDAAVADLLRGEVAPDPRELVNPARLHRGFLAYLARLGAVSSGWTWWTPPSEIARLFDKRACSALHRTHGIPVPEELPVPSTRVELLGLLQDRGWKRAVMKASFGSSASCLAVIDQRVTMTTLRWDEGWFNSLRVQRVSDPAQQDRVFRFLSAQEPQIQRFVPKLRHDGSFFDCRILCIAGEPLFGIVRQAHHPITNLHLGGWRGDLDALVERLGPAWESALQTCRRVAALHDAHHLGIDVMFQRDHSHLVLEVNAFGDLLPRLERDGMDVYTTELTRYFGL